MKKILLTGIFVVSFFLTSVALLFLTLNFSFAAEEKPKPNSVFLVDGENKIFSPIDYYFAQSQTRTKILAAVDKSDSRPVIVDNFLAKHNSPMTGMGSVFVREADKYNLDYRLLPAIAFQESTLGKKIPRGSHNAFGWAIYTGANSGATFKDWEHAIEVVAAGLKKNYIDKGLISPEEIMLRYTKNNDGNWVFGVNFAIEEMTPK